MRHGFCNLKGMSTTQLRESTLLTRRKLSLEYSCAKDIHLQLSQNDTTQLLFSNSLLFWQEKSQNTTAVGIENPGGH
jgi:hypothetical protein